MAANRTWKIVLTGTVISRGSSRSFEFDDAGFKRMLAQLKFLPEGTKFRGEFTEYDESKEEERLRTEAQNRYYHKMLDLICEHTGDDHLDLHDTLKAKFLGRPKVIGDKEYIIVPSTTGLNSKNFGSYLEKVHKFAAEELEVILPDATNIF